MRITVGDYVIDHDPAASTTAGVSLDVDETLNISSLGALSVQWNNLHVFVEGDTESEFVTRLVELRDALDGAEGRNIKFEQTPGQIIHEIDPTDWAEIFVSHETETLSNTSAHLVIVPSGGRDSPPAGGGGGGANFGQIGDIEFELELLAGGLAMATATADFQDADDAQAWWALMYGDEPPLPDFFPDGLRPVSGMLRPIQPVNREASDPPFTPVSAHIVLRQIQSGVTLPDYVSDLYCQSEFVEDRAIDAASGQAEGVSLIQLSGNFTVVTESPNPPGLPGVGRGGMYDAAVAAYEAIETDFQTIHGQFDLRPLGDPIINIGLDTGQIQFSRMFSTGRVLQWDETLEIRDIHTKSITRVHDGSDTLEESAGGPVRLATHNFMAVTLDAPVGYNPPSLGPDWEEMESARTRDVRTTVRGGVSRFTSTGSSAFRLVNARTSGGDATQNQIFDALESAQNASGFSGGSPSGGHAGQFG